jgi:hypothetical protein
MYPYNTYMEKTNIKVYLKRRLKALLELKKHPNNLNMDALSFREGR